MILMSMTAIQVSVCSLMSTDTIFRYDLLDSSALTINIKIHNMKEDGVTTLSEHIWLMQLKG